MFCDEGPRRRDLPVGHAFCEGLDVCRFRPQKGPRPGEFDSGETDLRLGDSVEVFARDGVRVHYDATIERRMDDGRLVLEVEDGDLMYAYPWRCRKSS